MPLLHTSASLPHSPPTHTKRPTTTTASLHHRLAPLRDDEPTNIEYAVDYSEENAADELQAMQEHQQRQQEVMTFSTHFPAPAALFKEVSVVAQQQHHKHVRPLHELHAADAESDDTGSSLAAAVNHAWTRARAIASRLAAADAAAAAQLVAELEATVDTMVAAQDAAAAAAAAANDVIDHRWDTFEPQQQEADQQQHMDEVLLVHDIGSMRPRRSDAAAASEADTVWSEAFADYIDPIRQYVSGMDDYDQAEWLSQQQQQQEDAEFTAASSSIYNASPSSSYDARTNHLDSMAIEYDYDDYSISSSSRGGDGGVVGMLPADPSLAAASAAAAPYPAEPDEDDIGMFISPDDQAANNNMLLSGGKRGGADSSSSSSVANAWSAAMLEWMSVAPLEQLDAAKAAAVLLVGCTLMVLVAFIVSVVDLRATVHATATAAPKPARTVAGGSNSSGSSRGGGSSSYNVVAPLRTRKSAFGGCSSSSASATAAAVVAAAAASMGATTSSSGCCDVDDLSMPLLLDADEDDSCVADTAADVEAPRAAVVGPSASLPRVLQKFYNPLHYQVLPSCDQE